MKEYIEREALLVLIEEAWENARIQSSTFAKRSGKTLWHGIFSGINYCRNRLLEAPAADVVEVRHGRWEEAEDDYFGLYIIKCSECREEWCFEVDDDVKDLNYNYCPHCGAKMDKEE